MKELVKIGIVHGRYQPPHNGHIRSIFAELNHSEHILIGICTPEICTAKYSKKTGYPCTKELNPFTYEERKHMIAAALSAAAIPQEKFTIIPLPSDYKNIKDLIPDQAVFFITSTGQGDTEKSKYLEGLGYRVKILESIQPENRKEMGSKIRSGFSQNEPNWEEDVPENVAKFIKERGSIN